MALGRAGFSAAGCCYGDPLAFTGQHRQLRNDPSSGLGEQRHRPIRSGRATLFNPNVVEVVDADPTKAGVQVQDGSFLAHDFVVSRDADNVAGTVQYILTQLNPTSAVDGSGVLFTILFRAKAASISPLSFTR